MKFTKVFGLFLFAVVFLESCINMSSARPTRTRLARNIGPPLFTLKHVQKANTYLLKYGYMDGWGYPDKEELITAMKGFQLYAGLRPSVPGLLDLATYRLMRKDRCGVKDPYLRMNFNHAKRQYTPSGIKWSFKDGSTRTLTWKVENAARGLSFQKTLEIIRSAFKKWEKVANINFHEVTKYDADIIVKFAIGLHADPYLFDGKGGAVAHSFYPYPGVGIGGDIHIDNDENFKQGTDLMWVAVHQIGHSLGLDHSGLRSAIMSPWNMRKIGADFNLTQDDIEGIQSLYGPRPGDGKKKTTPSPTKLVKTAATTLARYYP